MRSLLAQSMQTLLDTAKMPLPENWDQTIDLPQVSHPCSSWEGVAHQNHEDRSGHMLSFGLQVCAVHTMQALVRGSGVGVAVLQFAPAVAICSLTLLSSPCWAMRNAAL